MSFFGKLKNKLFKSSSKLDEGLDAIVQDGGSEDPSDTGAPQDVAREAPADVLEPDTLGAALDATPAPTARISDPVVEEQPPETGPVEKADESVATAKQSPEAAVRVSKVEPQAPEAAEEIDAPDPKPADQTPDVPPAAREVAPLSAPAKTHDVDIDAAKTEPERRSAGSKISAAPDLEALVEAGPVERPPSTPSKPGLIGRLFGRSAGNATASAPIMRRALDDDMLEQLEELLIASDMGVETALRVTANIAEGRFGKRLSTREIKQLLAAEIARIMEPVARPLPLYPSTPQVVLVVGVNGSGKTTTIGKLASQFRAAGKSVVIAAGDTFRAAAVEQLQVWGDRAGVPVLTAPEGSDPASLAYDAMGRAQADGADLLMIDTAGRLQNRADLMEELSKIVRVIRKKDPSAPHNTLLVLDATTGQNALNQVETFQKLADVSGLVMTKLDGTAKGGVLVALADRFGLPIHAIGVGEQIDDLAPFDPEEFAAALTGLETE